jgi:hypothetical protein
MGIIGYSSLKHGFELLNIQSIDSQIGIGPFERLFLWGGIATSVVLGVFPQLLIPWIARTVLGFSSTIP